MDQMLPSPGFSIPSIGTPMHQPEEDQQIMTNHAYPQFGSQQMAPPSQQQSAQHSMVGLGSSSGMPGIGSNQLQSMGLPSLMQTPAKMMQASSYQPSYATPQQNIMQPQTPVIWFWDIV